MNKIMAGAADGEGGDGAAEEEAEKVMSRAERDAAEAARKKAAYDKTHAAGETDE